MLSVCNVVSCASTRPCIKTTARSWYTSHRGSCSRNVRIFDVSFNSLSFQKACISRPPSTVCLTLKSIPIERSQVSTGHIDTRSVYCKRVGRGRIYGLHVYVPSSSLTTTSQTKSLSHSILSSFCTRRNPGAVLQTYNLAGRSGSSSGMSRLRKMTWADDIVSSRKP